MTPYRSPCDPLPEPRRWSRPSIDTPWGWALFLVTLPLFLALLPALCNDVSAARPETLWNKNPGVAALWGLGLFTGVCMELWGWDWSWGWLLVAFGCLWVVAALLQLGWMTSDNQECGGARWGYFRHPFVIMEHEATRLARHREKSEANS